MFAQEWYDAGNEDFVDEWNGISPLEVDEEGLIPVVMPVDFASMCYLRPVWDGDCPF